MKNLQIYPRNMVKLKISFRQKAVLPKNVAATHSSRKRFPKGETDWTQVIRMTRKRHFWSIYMESIAVVTRLLNQTIKPA